MPPWFCCTLSLDAKEVERNFFLTLVNTSKGPPYVI